MSSIEREEQAQMAQTSLSEANANAHEEDLKSLFSNDGVGASGLVGNGFTYRHDWGNRRGKWKLNLHMGGITCNSRVWVTATEFGGGQQCGFIGDAAYTVQNVATSNGVISVQVVIDWPDPIRVRLDYLIVNP
jgi:hypothetical protein